MDTHERLRQLLNERGWTEYRLSKECGLSESTLANIFRRNTVPSISTLEAICTSFGISLSQFFAESEMPYTLTKTQAQLLEASTALSEEQQLALIEFIKTL